MTDCHIPSNWSTAQLLELCEEVKENVHPEPGHEYVLYSVPSFPDGPELADGSDIGSTKRVLAAGDVLLCKINPRINRVWQVADHGPDAIVIGSSEWVTLRLRPDAPVTRKYLTWYLRSPAFREWISANVSGVTGSHTRAKPKVIMQQPVPFPSLGKQRAIVETIERMLSHLDVARGSATAARVRLLTFQSSSLELLLQAAGNDNAAVPLEEIWKSARYGTSERCAEDGGGIPVLRIPNVRRRAVDLTDIKSVVNQQADVAAAVVQAGDILVIRTNGSRSLIGRTAAVPDLPREFACASYLIRLRLDTSRVRPAFVAACLEAPSVRSKLEELAASSAGQYNLNVSKLRTIALPVPPLETQDELLSRLQAHESVLAHLRSSVQLVEGRSAALGRSILKAAFEGRLTNHADPAPSVQDLEEAIA